MSPSSFPLALTLALTLVLTVFFAGCTLVNEPEPNGMRFSTGQGGAPVEVDTARVLSSIRGGAYRASSAFVHATRVPYPSAVASGSYVDEWVSSDAYAAYATIHPDTTGSRASVPVGTTILRAVVDVTGTAVSELTVMVKGPAGYNPDLGDWWFGVTDADGIPLLDQSGWVLEGRLPQCATCHLPRAQDDFLFGVPSDDHP